MPKNTHRGTIQMKRIGISLQFLLLSIFCLAGPVSAPASDFRLNNSVAQVYFSPKGAATEAIVKRLHEARREILVQAYSFTSAPIAAALIQAHRRGVAVQVILDKSQKSERYTSASFLANAGVPTFIDSSHAIAHNKIMIVDREAVITGSFNFTKAAEEKNAENLLIIPSKEMASLYLDNWLHHRRHSDAYQRRY